MLTRSRNVLLSVVAGALLVGPQARADDFGCQVLLCLSNPRGNPTSSECAAVLAKLWRHLAKPWASMPTCQLVGGEAGAPQSSRAVEVYDPFDPCPTGMHPELGWVSLSPEEEPRYSGPDQGSTFSGVAPRACVANWVGSYTRREFGTFAGYEVRIYDRIVWQAPQPPRAIDVYVDGVFQQRVRW